MKEKVLQAMREFGAHNMEIKAVKFRKDGFYTQPFVMGGEGGDPEELPDDWRCPRCKQPKTKFNKA